MMTQEPQPETSTQSPELAIVKTVNAPLEQMLARMTDASKSSAVFAPPVQRDNTTVITCSEVYVALGVGLGAGNDTSTGPQQGNDSGGGGGGGGVAKGRPIAAIVVSPEGVRIEPIVDATRIAMAAITTLGFMVFWVVRLMRAAGNPSLDGGPSLRDFKRQGR